MRFDCGPTAADKYRAKLRWHKFFCLFPRRMTNLNRDCRWLEYIERRGTEKMCGWDIHIDWEYRPLDK